MNSSVGFSSTKRAEETGGQSYPLTIGLEGATKGLTEQGKGSLVGARHACFFYYYLRRSLKATVTSQVAHGPENSEGLDAGFIFSNGNNINKTEQLRLEGFFHFLIPEVKMTILHCRKYSQIEELGRYIESLLVKGKRRKEVFWFPCADDRRAEFWIV